VSSPLFFAHIRAAIGSAVQQTNCHPFRRGRWLIVHNGFIDFAAIKRDLVLAVDESLFPEIKGQSDTEVLVYLALTFGLERTIRRMLARAIAIDADRLPSNPKLIGDAVRLRSGHPRQGVRLHGFVRGGSRAFALTRYGHP
jgi:predicted glutamine amidotransferase